MFTDRKVESLQAMGSFLRHYKQNRRYTYLDWGTHTVIKQTIQTEHTKYPIKVHICERKETSNRL
jgi:hypothetical protein